MPVLPSGDSQFPGLGEGRVPVSMSKAKAHLTGDRGHRAAYHFRPAFQPHPIHLSSPHLRQKAACLLSAWLILPERVARENSGGREAYGIR